MTSTLFSLLLTSLLVPAHPFGQNSVDQALRVEVQRESETEEVVVTLRLSLDVAEVVTAQVMVQLDRDHDGDVTSEEKAAYQAYMEPRTARELALRVDGEVVPLEPAGFELGFFAGDQGFPTIRMTLRFAARVAPSSGLGHVEVRNRCFSHLRGRRRLKVDLDPTLGLREAPSDEREEDRRRLTLLSTAPGASITARPTTDGEGAPMGALAATGDHPLLALIRSPGRGWRAWLWGLALAFALGMLHAFSPGHGKTLAAAFLLGRRARARHALWLGLSVTAAHVVAVFALGLAALSLAERLLVDALAGYVTAASGMALMLIGAWMLFRRLGHDHHHHHHVHGHAHHGHEHTDQAHHDHAHSAHEPGDAPPSLRETLALGFSGGVAPCPTALVILLLAMAVGRVAFGMALIVAFSLGMSLVLVLGGLTVVLLGHQVTKRAPRLKGWYPVLARLSAAVIVTVGALIALAGLQQAGLVRVMI